MSKAPTWSCDISLQFMYKTDGSPEPAFRSVPFISDIINKEEVEISIRRAQSAILNPDILHVEFLDKTADELRVINRTSLKFSKNVVVIHIFDPNAVEFSFIDLPGTHCLQSVARAVLICIIRADSEWGGRGY